MARYTAAYSSFIRRLDEVGALVSLAQRSSREPTAQNLATMAALCRGAVVLLSSHIEGYVEELGGIVLERIVDRSLEKKRLHHRFLYYCSRDVIDALRNTAEPDRIAGRVRELFTRDAHIWGTDATFPLPLDADRFSAGFSNPTTQKITRYFNRFGYERYRHDLAHLLAAQFTACWNMIDQVVEQRNRIAHGETVTVGTPTDVADMVRVVKLFCRCTDDVVARWFAALACPIR